MLKQLPYEIGLDETKHVILPLVLFILTTEETHRSETGCEETGLNHATQESTLFCLRSV